MERFIKKLSVKNVKIHSGLVITEPYLLVTYTTKFGEVPETTTTFLERSFYNCLGVASSGNLVWGKNFAIAADKISENYGIPTILKFELSGTNRDVEIFLEGLRQING